MNLSIWAIGEPGCDDAVADWLSCSRQRSIGAVGEGDGKQKWQHQIMAGIMTTPYEQGGLVYVAGSFEKGKFYALKAENGSQVWALDLEGISGGISVVP